LTSSNLNFRLARDQVVHLKTATNLCASQPDVKKPLKSATFLTREGIHYSTRKLINNSAMTDQINKVKNLNISGLLVWRQKWVASVRQLALRSLSPLAR